MLLKALVLILEQPFNMKISKIILFLIIILQSINLNADAPYFVDFKYILNESTAGKKAQNQLKSKLDGGLKKFKKQEDQIQEEEKKIIQQKKLITPEEYKKKVSELRNKVSTLQKDKRKLINEIARERTKARNELLKNLNPILEEYMKKNNIRMIIDKKNILLADEKLSLTDDVIKLLNQKLKSIKLN